MPLGDDAIGLTNRAEDGTDREYTCSEKPTGQREQSAKVKSKPQQCGGHAANPLSPLAASM